MCQAPCKRNIVGCHMLRPFAHPVACCWMLLRVVAQSLKPVKLFSQQLPTVSFDPFAQLFQHCWGHARSLRMVYKDLWVVSLPRCTAGPSIAGSCCIRLHTAANTYATIPNIVGSCCVRLHAASGVRCKHCRRYKPEVKRGTPENRA